MSLLRKNTKAPRFTERKSPSPSKSHTRSLNSTGEWDEGRIAFATWMAGWARIRRKKKDVKFCAEHQRLSRVECESACGCMCFSARVVGLCRHGGVTVSCLPSALHGLYPTCPVWLDTIQKVIRIDVNQFHDFLFWSNSPAC